jgi:uncharacterized BrkB/YihY/UPF0761 family membrane protein
MTEVERVVEVDGQATGTLLEDESVGPSSLATVRPVESTTATATDAQSAHASPPNKGTRSDGITLLAIYHFILGGIFLLGMFGVSLPAVITALVGIFEDPEVLIATAILAVIAMVLMVFVVFFLAIGYGLWQRKQWARIASMVVAVLSLFGFPIGTFIGGFTIWYLIQPDVVAEFEG